MFSPSNVIEKKGFVGPHGDLLPKGAVSTVTSAVDVILADSVSENVFVGPQSDDVQSRGAALAVTSVGEVECELSVSEQEVRAQHAAETEVCDDCVKDECAFICDTMQRLATDVGVSGLPEGLAVYSIKWDDVTVVEDSVCPFCEQVHAMAALKSNVTEKFDTACSRSISGAPGRIREVDVSHNIVIKGFNEGSEKVDKVGVNGDDMQEYFVSGMPKDLALLSGNDYVSRGGAAVLFPHDGIVLRVDAAEQQMLRTYIAAFPVWKQLCVKNRTYEVVPDGEEAYAATNYFNTKVNVTTGEERVLTYLLTGLTLRDIQSAIQHKSVDGFHPELGSRALSSFERKWGRTPDVVHLAHPNKIGNVKNYMAKPTEYTHVGQLVEMDNFESDFNESDTLDDITSVESGRKRVRKLPTHGGAIAANVTYDVYSGYVHGRLLQSMANPEECVQATIDLFAAAGYKIDEFAADRGILHEGKFRVATAAVVGLLRRNHIGYRGAEPGNHSNGTPHVERIIGVIQEKMRMAVQYILRNPNLKYLEFSKKNILQLWGELFHWAIVVINLKECPHVKGKTRYEVYHGKKPSIQEIRLLPIFSVLMVLREEPNAAAIDGANRRFYQYGLYVGPDSLVKGGIRVAVLTNKRLQIVVSSKYKGVTDGGSINLYPQVQRGLRQLLEDQAIEDVPQEPESAVVPAVTVSNVDVLPEVTVSAGGDISTQERGGSAAEPRGDESPPRPQPVRAESVAATEKKKRKTHRGTRKPQPDKPKRILGEKAAKDVEDALRLARYLKRQESANYAKEWQLPSIETTEQLQAMFADWTVAKSEGSYFYSMRENAFYCVGSEVESVLFDMGEFVEEGYRAVTTGIPKNYILALEDPKWGEPARVEWNTITETKTMVEVDAELAKRNIAAGADLVVIFPVYEEKEKEGRLVQKVRLVGDGRTHYGAKNTYSATPSREELLVILHIVARYGWKLCHIDEIRAFLNAKYKGDSKVYAKMKGSDRYYEVLKALYGLRSSPRDYGDEVKERLESLGFRALIMSPKLYVLQDMTNDSILIVYDFVDDFIFTSNNTTVLEDMVVLFRTMCNTTAPAWDPKVVLGMEIERDYEHSIIKVYMRGKIRELAEKCEVTSSTHKHVPIPKSGYIVRESEFEGLPRGQGELVGVKARQWYLEVVGCLIWLIGVRLDITFATTYLAWSTKSPREHHITMAKYVVSYLYHSIDVPLVLGGHDDVGVIAASDASLGTGPKGRSISAVFVRLGKSAGGVMAKSRAGQCVSLSSFEAELDACCTAIKLMRYFMNLLKELGIQPSKPVLQCDNMAMIDFVKGEGVAKGVRHMELRMWYTREQYLMNNMDLMYTSGKVISADKLTKLGDRLDHAEFMRDVQGLHLLPDFELSSPNDMDV